MQVCLNEGPQPLILDIHVLAKWQKYIVDLSRTFWPMLTKFVITFLCNVCSYDG